MVVAEDQVAIGPRRGQTDCAAAERPRRDVDMPDRYAARRGAVPPAVRIGVDRAHRHLLHGNTRERTRTCALRQLTQQLFLRHCALGEERQGRLSRDTAAVRDAVRVRQADADADDALSGRCVCQASIWPEAASNVASTASWSASRSLDTPASANTACCSASRLSASRPEPRFQVIQSPGRADVPPTGPPSLPVHRVLGARSIAFLTLMPLDSKRPSPLLSWAVLEPEYYRSHSARPLPSTRSWGRVRR